jgi:predicted metal-dependent hydrolase
MARRSRRASEEFHFDINSVTIPVKVFYEYRRDVRVALGKDSVRLRIPRHCTTSQRDSYKNWCVKWVMKQWDKNPRFRATFTDFDIYRLIAFNTFDTTFKVQTDFTLNKHAYGKINGITIHLEFPSTMETTGASEAGYKLIHKLLASHYNEDLQHRVATIHDSRFTKPIASVKLKNMSSKWGSCSHTGRMSFSTRLLFAPKKVQDYVIIHELCHLKELNHSTSFWKLVEELDGSYRDKEKWLKKYGHLCDLGYQGANAVE